MGTVELVTVSASVFAIIAVVISVFVTRGTSRDANVHPQDILDILKILYDRLRSRRDS